MKILIAKGKYGDRHFAANTKEELNKACVKLLRERLKQGYYYFEEEPELLIELPLCDNKEVAKEIDRIKSAQEYRHKRWEEDKDFHDRVTNILESDEMEVYGPQERLISYELLLSRSDGEYEGIELVSLEEV